MIYNSAYREVDTRHIGKVGNEKATFLEDPVHFCKNLIVISDMAHDINANASIERSIGKADLGTTHNKKSCIINAQTSACLLVHSAREVNASNLCAALDQFPCEPASSGSYLQYVFALALSSELGDYAFLDEINI